MNESNLFERLDEQLCKRNRLHEELTVLIFALLRKLEGALEPGEDSLVVGCYQLLRGPDKSWIFRPFGHNTIEPLGPSSSIDSMVAFAERAERFVTKLLARIESQNDRLVMAKCDIALASAAANALKLSFKRE